MGYSMFGLEAFYLRSTCAPSHMEDGLPIHRWRAAVFYWGHIAVEFTKQSYLAPGFSRVDPCRSQDQASGFGRYSQADGSCYEGYLACRARMAGYLLKVAWLINLKKRRMTSVVQHKKGVWALKSAEKNQMLGTAHPGEG